MEGMETAFSKFRVRKAGRRVSSVGLKERSTRISKEGNKSSDSREKVMVQINRLGGT